MVHESCGAETFALPVSNCSFSGRPAGCPTRSRAPSGNTIAFSVYSQDHDPSVDGVWLVRSDGTNLQRVAVLGYELRGRPTRGTSHLRKSRIPAAFCQSSPWTRGSSRSSAKVSRLNGPPTARDRLPAGSRLRAVYPRFACSLLARADRKLTRGADPVWSPDGRWVGFFRGTRSPPSLWAIPVYRRPARRLARRVSDSLWIMKSTRTPAPSRSSRTRTCSNDPHLVRVRGGAARRLAVEHGLVSPLAWTSARRLLYADRVCSGSDANSVATANLMALAASWRAQLPPRDCRHRQHRAGSVGAALERAEDMARLAVMRTS